MSQRLHDCAESKYHPRAKNWLLLHTQLLQHFMLSSLLQSCEFDKWYLEINLSFSQLIVRCSYTAQWACLSTVPGSAVLCLKRWISSRDLVFLLKPKDFTEIKWLLVNQPWTALIGEVFIFLYLQLSHGENLSQTQVFIFCSLCVWSSGGGEWSLPCLWQPSEPCEEGGNEQGHLLLLSRWGS